MRVGINGNDRRSLVLNYFVVTVCAFSSLYTALAVDMPGYELMFVMPLAYAIGFALVLSHVLINKSGAFFAVFSAFTFGRYVLLPFLIVLSGHYGGRSAIPPASTSYTTAILLIVYEFAAACLFIHFMEWRRHKAEKASNGNEQKELTIKERSNAFYWFFALILLGLGVLNPVVLRAINFLQPSQNVVRSFDRLSFIQAFTVYGIIVIKQVLFVVLCVSLYKRYKRNPRYSYVLMTGILAFLNISIYFGTNRSDVVIAGIASFILLQRFFGKRAKAMALVLILTLILVIVSISTVRGFAPVSNNSLVVLTDVLQCYLGGPYNVAIALETKTMYPEASELEVFLFDIVRPMIGINIFVKGLPIQYSNVYFNRRIWLGIDRRSQILPMVGQANLFFGWLLSPVLTIFFIWLGYLLRAKAGETRSPDLFYFLTLALIRLGFMMGQNTMNMINDLSMNLLLFIIIFVTNNCTSHVLMNISRRNRVPRQDTVLGESTVRKC